MPPMSSTEKKHRAMLRATIDTLAKADAATRTVATEHIKRTALPALLRMLCEMLIDRARRNRRTEVVRGAILSLVQLGAMGVMLVCVLALNSRPSRVREMSTWALRECARDLPPG